MLVLIIGPEGVCGVWLVVVSGVSDWESEVLKGSGARGDRWG